MVEVSTPPTMGAAMRFMMSAPVPVLNMMGTRPARMTLTVMILGRMRLTAPSMMEPLRSLPVVQPAFPLPSVIREIEVEEHDHPGLGIEPGERDDAHPHGDAQVVTQEIE